MVYDMMNRHSLDVIGHDGVIPLLWQQYALEFKEAWEQRNGKL